ncbi:MAG TPA: hypothetical protein VF755_08655 [Catenuloplanes sp.]|jgi:hypothetical protein
MSRSVSNGLRAGGAGAPERPTGSRRAGILTAVLGVAALVPTAAALIQSGAVQSGAVQSGSATTDWHPLALGLMIQVESTGAAGEQWWAAPGPTLGVGLLLLGLVGLRRR